MAYEFEVLTDALSDEMHSTVADLISDLSLSGMEEIEVYPAM